MALRGNFEWGSNREAYSEPQVEAILREAGVEVVGETERDFLCLCPYHYNTGSPAFSVSKETGQLICFNPSCGVKGNLVMLLRDKKQMTDLQARIAIEKAKTDIDYVSLIERASEKFEFTEYNEDKLIQYSVDLWESPGLDYMYGRGFEKATLEEFEIGYFFDSDDELGYVSVPMHADDGMCLGYIGRCIDDVSHADRFKNSPRLPKRMSAWNIHRAKKAGAVVIVCEASFDAMRIHQAGFPNVVALLGGSNLNRAIVDQLQRYFTSVIIMTDNDEGGRALGNKIEERLQRRVLWAVYGDGMITPEGTKDAGDMTDGQIGRCIRNAVSGLEYHEFYDTMDTWAP